MAASQEPDGKNSLLGEFLLSLARAPEHVQEAVVLFGLKQMGPYAANLILPYPMLSHLQTLVARSENGSDPDDI